MPLVVGVDSSTSACKVQVRDADTGALVAEGRAPHPPTTPPRSEQDPEDWWAAFLAACAEAGIPDRHSPAAIAVGGQQHGMVVLDGAGDVLRPAKLWNDTESAPDAEVLVDELGAEAWAAACGSVPVASFTITKLAWLRRSEPATFARVAAVLLPHDWLTARLTDQHSTDRGDASGTGYWSPAEGQYREDLLALVDGDPEWLPTVLGPLDVAGDWHGAVVAPGTGDNMAAALGLGLDPGELALSLGTSGTAFAVTDEPSADPSGTVAGFADATGRFLPLVCTLNATKVTDAVARLLGVGTAQLRPARARRATGRGRPRCSSPTSTASARPTSPTPAGTLTGLRTDVTREQLARSAVEGVVANLLAGADALDAAGDRILLIGGGAHSAAYRRVVADLTGRPVVIPAEEELVACGAAVQAAAVLEGCGIDEIADAWGLGDGEVIEPDPEVDRAAIRAAYAVATQSAG